MATAPSGTPEAPDMKAFYTNFYDAVERSRAHALFCERVFGRDLSQHGFADQEQLELLLRVIPMAPGQRAMDAGCGNGRITEYLSDRTGAFFTGLDYIPAAVEQARKRTSEKSDRLSFMVGDLNHLSLPDGAFDVLLSIDSIYFSGDYAATIRDFKTALKPGGRMVFFYSQGREPWVPIAQFKKETLAPDQTPLAKAFQANDLQFQTWELTSRDYQLAKRRKAVLEELKSEFESEGTMFIYENRHGDAEGIIQAVEEGLHARYLYATRAGKPVG
jgi:ubiquinone/menaquinone biosynthesis C-methylase UbiE